MRAHYGRILLALVVVVSLFGLAVTPAAAGHEDQGCEFPVTVTDATGTEVTIEEPPAEVVTTDAASAQTLWEIGADDRVTGMPVREYTAYLEGSANRTDVLSDDGTSVEVETVVDLQPDLVVVPNPGITPEETVEKLRDSGLTVYQSTFESSFEDIYAKTEVYGHLVGECESAETTAAETRDRVETVSEAVAEEEQPRVLYYFFGFTAGEGTFIADIVETAGGENVAANADIEGFKQISDEVVVEQDPEWVVAPDGESAIDTTEEPLASTTAVENDRVLRVDANLVSQAGPRVVEPLEALAAAFHPEVSLEETTDTPTETPTPAEADTPTDTPTPAEDPADGAGSGFGGVVAVCAVVAATVLLRRR